MTKLMDGMMFEVFMPLFVMGGLALISMAAVEIGGRIRAKMKGEEWVSPFIW